MAAVEAPVVVGRVQVAEGRVADDPHVYPVAGAAEAVLDRLRCAVGVEDLGRGPAFGVGNIRVRAVGCVAVLVDEVPELLGREVDFFFGGLVYALFTVFFYVKRGVYVHTSGAARYPVPIPD